MKKKLHYIKLTLLLYGNKLIEKITALVFNIQFAIKNRRRPKRLSKKQLKRFKKYLNTQKHRRD